MLRRFREQRAFLGRVVGVPPPASGAPSGAVPYNAGATYSFGGISVSMSGQPGNNDSFAIAPNSGGIGDNDDGAEGAADAGDVTVRGCRRCHERAGAVLGRQPHEIGVVLDEARLTGEEPVVVVGAETHAHREPGATPGQTFTVCA